VRALGGSPFDAMADAHPPPRGINDALRHCNEDYREACAERDRRARRGESVDAALLACVDSKRDAALRELGHHSDAKLRRRV